VFQPRVSHRLGIGASRDEHHRLDDARDIEPVGSEKRDYVRERLIGLLPARGSAPGPGSERLPRRVGNVRGTDVVLGALLGERVRRVA
jgi:hypothetical protein